MYVKDVRDFDVLKSLTKIEGKFVNLSPLRVGIGRDAPLGAVADLAVIRIRKREHSEPYIPGSSLKGILRNYLEQLLRANEPNLHDPWNNDKIKEEVEKGDFCVVCGIFGSTEVASHVKIFDAYPETRPTIIIKTSVSIDREFGGVRPGHLFTEELIEPGCMWIFRMDIINIPFPPTSNDADPRSILLQELLNNFKRFGIQVGARRSTGLGMVKLIEAKWTTYKVSEGSLKKVGEGII